MNELSLFSGAGGGLLATKHLLGWNTIGYVEIEEYCQKVIAQRIKDGLLDNAPIFTDIRAFNREGYAESYQGMVDVITAGFPCQPFSTAGKQRGEKDERNMWPETWTAIRKIRPRYAFLENVPGLLNSGYFNTILSDLHKIGYDAKWMCLSAADCMAWHKRERLWIYSYPKHSRFQRRYLQENGRKERQEREQQFTRLLQTGSWLDKAISGCFRKPDDMARGMDRLKAIGNGQVPIVAATAWKILSEKG